MQSWKRAIGSGISAGFGVKNQLMGKPAGLRILMYHSISKDQSQHTDDIYSLGVQAFADQLNFIRSHGGNEAFAVRSLTETDKVGIAITFDDGYLDNLEVAAPILVEYGYPFHVFVNPTFIISGEKKYLNKQTLLDLSHIPGVTIGAHGYSHRKLTECTMQELNYELSASKSFLENTLGKPVTTMAYPHGGFNRQIKDAVKEAGFFYAASSRFGIATAESDHYQLERTDIWANDKIATFDSKLRGNWDWMGYRG